jgi:glucose-1-phosphate adenylyltransferase
MEKVVAMILAGGQGERLSTLSHERAKPAVMFGGRYRIIDFTLSNCVNSGIYTVGVLTQYRPRSLNEHIGIGRPWDLDRSTGGGVTLLQPYTGRGESDWYRGTADAVYQNLAFLDETRADLVVVLAGDHVYRMQYDQLIAFHKAAGASATVGVVPVAAEDASRFGTVVMEADGRITGFDEKTDSPRSLIASMGIYVFNRDVLEERLAEDAHRRTSHDFGRDIMPVMVERDRVYGYRFDGYWRDVGTLEAYWQANMDLLVDLPDINLYDTEYPMLTRVSNYPPAKIGPRAHVSRSLLSEGCIVAGYVEHSVLSPGVHVEEGAVVKDSIIFNDTHIERGAMVERCVLDKEVIVGYGAQLGWGDDFSPNQQDPAVLYSGLTIVGKRAVLPSGLRVGRNCKIGPNVRPGDFTVTTLASGETIEVQRPANRPPF